ncbi:hypothetical protein ACFVVL_27735 [Kitasatospora sp. NPDC058115]|uniref:hypothetical protein n=1 Tax=Kitasatospora sp. NPDC058115 TaxID=3346347 RepID=UPI0036DCAA33
MLLQVPDRFGHVLDAVVGAVLVGGDQGVQLLVGGDLQHAQRREDVGAQRGRAAVGVAGGAAEVHPAGPGRLFAVMPLAVAVVLVVVHALPPGGSWW